MAPLKLSIAICGLLPALSAAAGSAPGSAPANAPASAPAPVRAPAPAGGEGSAAEMQQLLGLPRYSLEQCRAGSGYFCDFLAGLLQSTDKSRLPEAFSGELKLDELSARAFDADCDTEDAYGCFQTGMQLKGRGMNPAEGKLRRAVQVCERACADRQWPGCLLPLALSRVSDTTPGGEAKRDLYVRRACEGGFALACQHPSPEAFFTAMNSGAGLGQLGAASMRWLCDRGRAPHCALLGWSELTGMPGVPRDRAAALGHLQKACAQGDGMGCQMLAFESRAAPAAGITPAETNRALARACELNMGYACFTLAADQWDEKNRRMKEPARAFRLLTAACGADSGPGCALLAKLYLTGGGVPRDPAQGKALVEKACRLKFAPACEILAKHD